VANAPRPPPLPRRDSPSASPSITVQPSRAEYAFGPDDDEPTLPGNVSTDDRGATLQRLYANLTAEERRKLLLLADAWWNCDATDRVVLEAIAQRFAH
jgi:hypothetical protein